MALRGPMYPLPLASLEHRYNLNGMGFGILLLVFWAQLPDSSGYFNKILFDSVVVGNIFVIILLYSVLFVDR